MTVTPAPDIERRLDVISAAVDELLAETRRRRERDDRLTELIEEIELLGRPAYQSLVTRLGELDRRGYFDLGRTGLRVVDRVVTSFTEEDVEALGDNIVLILETVKEMTQPEVMSMLRRTFHTVGYDEPAQAPSVMALLRELRDPAVRRGLGRLLSMLRSLGDVEAGDSTPHQEA